MLELPPGPGAPRPADAGTATLLRHLAPGSRVLVQVEGDTVTQLECVVDAVTAGDLTFRSPDGLADDLEVLVTALFVSDAQRAADVVAFRQFERFADAAVAADEASFNADLYMLLYRQIRGIEALTAAQLYDDYSGSPGRIGCVRDLRRALGASVTALAVANVLSLDPGAALRIEGVLIRTIATLADVAAGAPDADSDVALITARAAREMVAGSVRDQLRVLESENVVASHSLTLPGAFAATLDGVRVDVPAQFGALTAADVRTDGLVALAARLQSVASERADIGAATAASLDAARVRARTADFDCWYADDYFGDAWAWTSRARCVRPPACRSAATWTAGTSWRAVRSRSRPA